MAYVRGHARDYERWGETVGDGWDYAGVLPYFKKCETYSEGGCDYRGDAGPLFVTAGMTGQNDRPSQSAVRDLRRSGRRGRLSAHRRFQRLPTRGVWADGYDDSSRAAAKRGGGVFAAAWRAAQFDDFDRRARDQNRPQKRTGARNRNSRARFCVGGARGCDLRGGGFVAASFAVVGDRRRRRFAGAGNRAENPAARSRAQSARSLGSVCPARMRKARHIAAVDDLFRDGDGRRALAFAARRRFARLRTWRRGRL